MPIGIEDEVGETRVQKELPVESYGKTSRLKNLESIKDKFGADAAASIFAANQIEKESPTRIRFVGRLSPDSFERSIKSIVTERNNNSAYYPEIIQNGVQLDSRLGLALKPLEVVVPEKFIKDGKVVEMRGKRGYLFNKQLRLFIEADRRALYLAGLKQLIGKTGKPAVDAMSAGAPELDLQTASYLLDETVDVLGPKAQKLYNIASGLPLDKEGGVKPEVARGHRFSGPPRSAVISEIPAEERRPSRPWFKTGLTLATSISIAACSSIHPAPITPNIEISDQSTGGIQASTNQINKPSIPSGTEISPNTNSQETSAITATYEIYNTEVTVAKMLSVGPIDNPYFSQPFSMVDLEKPVNGTPDMDWFTKLQTRIAEMQKLEQIQKAEHPTVLRIPSVEWLQENVKVDIVEESVPRFVFSQAGKLYSRLPPDIGKDYDGPKVEFVIDGEVWYCRLVGETINGAVIVQDGAMGQYIFTPSADEGRHIPFQITEEGKYTLP